MPETFAYWSEQAREEFSALFDDEAYSQRFRQLVADGLVRGWSNNKDKPFWALAVLVGALGEAGRASRPEASVRRPMPDGLEILSRSVADTWSTLVGAASDGAEGAASVRREGADRLTISFDGTSLSLSRTRLAVLRKLAEFLIVCDDFKFARETTAILQRLAAQGLAEAEPVKADIRAMARMAYAYRTRHFRDTSAQSAFGILMQFLSVHSNFEIEDDSVVAFWAWERNDKYRTYEAAFAAFVDLYEALKEVAANREFVNTSTIDDPLVERILVDCEDPESLLIEAESRAGEEAEDVGCDDDGGDGANEDDHAHRPGPRAAQIIDGAPMKLLPRQDLRLLQHFAEFGSFGFTFPRASIRLVAFHPVQSGLSNALRTGRSKLSIEERLSCVEAVAYEDIEARAEAIASRMDDLLKAALARRMGGDQVTTPEVSAVRDKGLVILADVRARRGGRDGISASAAEWRAVEPALIEAKNLAAAFSRRLEAAAGGKTAAGNLLAEWFDKDKALFSGHYRHRYSGSGAVAGSDSMEGAR